MKGNATSDGGQPSAERRGQRHFGFFGSTSRSVRLERGILRDQHLGQKARWGWLPRMLVKASWWGCGRKGHALRQWAACDEVPVMAGIGFPH